jgi:serpin B
MGLRHTPRLISLAAVLALFGGACAAEDPAAQAVQASPAQAASQIASAAPATAPPAVTTGEAMPPSSDPAKSQKKTSAAVHMLGALLAAAEAKGGANAVVSSLSIAQALHLARAGARGRTRDAFDQTLWGAIDSERGVDEMPPAPRDSGVVFEIANAAFLAESLPLVPGYSERIKDQGAAIERVDFAAPATLQKVNQWYSDRTRGHIPRMFSDLPADTRFVLGNALYFKGAWQDAFDPARTVEAPFRSKHADKARLMSAERVWRYAELEDGAQVIELPFRGGDYAMWVVLPKGSPSEWLAGGAALTRLLGEDRLSFARIALSLPRFEVSAGGDFTEIIKGLGLSQAFSPCADFTAMSPEDLRLGLVVHRATMKVDEEGAVATAATGVTGVRSASAPATEMRVDRPFIAMVVATQTREPIVAAVVHKPEG